MWFFLALALFASAPQVGQMAPDFTLPSQDGSKVSLHDFRGHWVVLYFYPKDGTSGCTLEAHNFQRDIQKYQQLNAEIVGVSVDTPDSHKEFCAKQGLHFKLLADTEKKVSEAYDSLMMIIHYSSRNTFLISPDGKIAKVWLGVSPAKHSEEVLTALSTLKNSALLNPAEAVPCGGAISRQPPSGRLVACEESLLEAGCRLNSPPYTASHSPMM